MKTNTIVLIILLIVTGCKDDKLTEQPAEEQIEEIKLEDSLNQLQIDSTVTTEIGQEDTKTSVEPKIKLNPKSERIIPPKPKNNAISIIPIEHASMILETSDISIYVDPVGGKERYNGYRPPNYILVTDIHGDHFNLETIEGIANSNTIIIGPRAVKKKMPAELLKNFTVIFNGLTRGFKTSKYSLDITGVAMYNLRKEALKYHPKGRGNGYVLNLNKKRIYISGDTEDILEMKQLKNIDIAFICMNLPYTMTVESAAEAVLAFKPKTVYPYHYRGSDINLFGELVNSRNNDIKIVQLNWYPPSS